MKKALNKIPKEAKEILREQLKLLAEVSKRDCPTKDLPEITKCMVLIAKNL